MRCRTRPAVAMARWAIKIWKQNFDSCKESGRHDWSHGRDLLRATNGLSRLYHKNRRAAQRSSFFVYGSRWIADYTWMVAMIIALTTTTVQTIRRETWAWPNMLLIPGMEMPGLAGFFLDKFASGPSSDIIWSMHIVSWRFGIATGSTTSGTSSISTRISGGLSSSTVSSRGDKLLVGDGGALHMAGS